MTHATLEPLAPAALPAPRGTPCLIARQLTVGYSGEPIVADVSVDLCPGESLALVGINGSGKSTLLRTMVGLLPALSGSLTIFGQAPGTTPRRIAYLGQARAASFILPLRAIDVVAMGCFPRRGLFGRITPEDRAQVRAAMATMGVAHLADAPLRTLSGGQQQRVYLAQVLVQRADMLVLDEPTAGLDAGGRVVYLDAMQAELARGAALITATHDIQEAAACTQAMLLSRRVVAQGPGHAVLTPEALLETFGVVITMTDRQLGVAVVEREHGHSH
ncbi:MAG: metal ABC transporter ATP-binding protein [Chloroflexales bacterium]